ncbi:ORF85 [Chlamys acute necrobiotic virus]|nr:ORF85 [Chlamys acute necrobiotic virus]AVQ67859.1 ORF86 [Ostreid herpesvirus 1]
MATTKKLFVDRMTFILKLLKEDVDFAPCIRAAYIADGMKEFAFMKPDMDTPLEMALQILLKNHQGQELTSSQILGAVIYTYRYINELLTRHEKDRAVFDWAITAGFCGVNQYNWLKFQKDILSYKSITRGIPFSQ